MYVPSDDHLLGEIQHNKEWETDLDLGNVHLEFEEMSSEFQLGDDNKSNDGHYDNARMYC